MPKPSSKKTEKAVEELTYEEALAELEEIVSALEGDFAESSLTSRSNYSSGDKPWPRIAARCLKRRN